MCPCCARDCEHGDDTDLEEQLSDAKQATVDDRGGTEVSTHFCMYACMCEAMQVYLCVECVCVCVCVSTCVL